MRRRLQFARSVNDELGNILSQDTVMLNDKRMLGFEPVINKLEK